MDNGVNERLALKFRQLAEHNFESQNLDHAYFYFLNCLQLCPSWKEELREKFFIVTNCLGQLLEQKEKYVEIFEVYKEAVDIYEDSAELFCNLGAHLLRLKYTDQAIVYLKKALEKNPAYFPAYRNLHSAYCASVERWHYRMLNDTVRNNAFKDVIFRKIAEGFDSVLDIGTGTGLFCLYAHWAGAKSIYACDYNQTMLSIAAQVFYHHQMADKVKLISKISNSIRIPNDIPERVSLVVTETMDSCMLGEHILHTLNYAWKHLLKPPYLMGGGERKAMFNTYGAVIPSGGKLWFTLIQSHTVAKNYMFPLMDLFADDCAFALANISFQNANETKKFRNLNLFRVSLKTSLIEPYDTERLQNLPDVKYLTESNVLLSINFNDPSQIETLVTSKSSVWVNVDCVCDGFLHAVSSWFTTYLDESATLCSAPNDVNAKNCCWDQAVFPTTKSYQVFSGSKVSILSEWSGGKITLEVKKISHPNGAVVFPDALPIPVSVGCVKLLNDSKLVECLQNAARNYIQAYPIKTLRIMDLFPVPLFGLAVLSNSLLNGTSCDNVELVCVVKSSSEEEMIRIIAQTNSIPPSCLSFVRIDEFDEAITRQWLQYFDVILLNLLDSEGVLNEEAICHLNSLKLLLKPEGLLLPKQIMIYGKLIHSDYIEECMRIVNYEINGYGIGQLMNEFQVPQLFDVNINTLIYEEFSNPFLCYTFTPENLDTKLQEMHAVLTVQNGTVNSILCWFGVNFFDDHAYHLTLNKLSSVHQTAFLSYEPLVIQQNEFITVDFVYHHGAFFMNLRKCDTNV